MGKKYWYKNMIKFFAWAQFVSKDKWREKPAQIIKFYIGMQILMNFLVFVDSSNNLW